MTCFCHYSRRWAVSIVRWYRASQEGLITCTVISECVCVLPKEIVELSICFSTPLWMLKKYTVRSLSYTNCESALLISTAAVLLSHKASSSKVTFYWNVFWQPQSVLQLCFLQETVLVSRMELSFSSRFPSFVSSLLNSFRSSIVVWWTPSPLRRELQLSWESRWVSDWSALIRQLWILIGQGWCSGKRCIWAPCLPVSVQTPDLHARRRANGM